VDGVTSVIVHWISKAETDSAFGTLPRKVVKSGIQVPQVWVLSRTHTTSVPDNSPLTSAPDGSTTEQFEPANVTD
jgi:hypothetical protein